jgi:hypothetical protein
MYCTLLIRRMLQPFKMKTVSMIKKPSQFIHCNFQATEVNGDHTDADKILWQLAKPVNCACEVLYYGP